jgi:hypothetical protein
MNEREEDGKPGVGVMLQEHFAQATNLAFKARLAEWEKGATFFPRKSKNE